MIQQVTPACENVWWWPTIFVNIPWLELLHSLLSDWTVSCPCHAERSRLAVAVPTPLPRLLIGVADECQRLAPACAAASPGNAASSLVSVVTTMPHFPSNYTCRARLLALMSPTCGLLNLSTERLYRHEHSLPKMCMCSSFKIHTLCIMSDEYKNVR